MWLNWKTSKPIETNKRTRTGEKIRTGQPFNQGSLIESNQIKWNCERRLHSSRLLSFEIDRFIWCERNKKNFHGHKTKSKHRWKERRKKIGWTFNDEKKYGCNCIGCRQMPIIYWVYHSFFFIVLFLHILYFGKRVFVCVLFCNSLFSLV